MHNDIDLMVTGFHFIPLLPCFFSKNLILCSFCCAQRKEKRLDEKMERINQKLEAANTAIS